MQTFLPRIYRYVLRSDGGDAPCTESDLVTLATCKPITRRVARVGDWVAGFYGTGRNRRPELRRRLAWAGVVDRKLTWSEYSEYHPRADLCYLAKKPSDLDWELQRGLSLDGHSPVWRRTRPRYHEDIEQMNRDIRNPVLIFKKDRVWYFGANAARNPIVDDFVPQNQGHRLTIKPDEVADFVKLILAFPKPTEEPLHPDDSIDWSECNKNTYRSPNLPDLRGHP